MTNVLRLACLLSVLAPAASAADTVYVVAGVPHKDPAEFDKRWKPFVSDLAERTGLKLKLAQPTKDEPAFYENYRAGRFDIAFVNPSIYATTKPGLYRAVARQDGNLQGVLIVRHDSGVTVLRDLKGSKIAFPSQESYAATTLVQKELAGASLQPGDYEAAYVGNHERVVKAVIDGQAAAGGTIMRQVTSLSPEDSQKIRVLKTTPPSITHPFTVNARVPEDVALRIQAAVLAMSTDPKGLKLLKDIGLGNMIAAKDSDYDSLRK